jgi:hypothetical protein
MSKNLQGVYSTVGSKTVKVGPIIEMNSFGLALVEILEGVKQYGRYEYIKGSKIWLNPSRITWNEGELS